MRSLHATICSPACEDPRLATTYAPTTRNNQGRYDITLLSRQTN